MAATEAEELDRYRAPALDKGLDILELLAATEEGLSQAEIAKALERSPNEIYRMLDRLVRRDYVRRTSADRYELTLKLFELSHMTPPIRRLVSQATPVLRRFARDSEQAVHLAIHDRNILVVVAQVDGPGYWNVSIRVGSRLSLVNTGSGHVFLAFATDEERALMLEDQGEKLAQQLLARLRRVREQGYEAMASRQVAGVTNLSVPIFGPLGTVIAALTSPYTERLDKHDAPDQASVLRLLIAAGNDISQRSTAKD
ncbi:MAG: IclR family transcriptional regulator [Propionibacteriaceae bacterium]|nr:IclR family transcriptional regulator [Propionibacteriaceae bacterium]